jgi:P27 family predicted phage terminase small subunit
MASKLRKSRPPVAAAVVVGGDPEKPRFVAADPVASSEWDRVVAHLRAAGTLHAGLVGVIAAYAAAYSIMSRGMLSIGSSVAVPTARGTMKSNPAARLVRDAAKDLLAIASELGLTPASVARSARVVLGDDADQDDDEV